MSTLKFTKSQAIDEITYRARAIAKPRPPRDFVPGDARFASGAELRAKAGESKPRKAAKPAPKAPAAPKELTTEQKVSRLITQAAQAVAGAVEGPGFVKRTIKARAEMLNAGDLEAQVQAALKALASVGNVEAEVALAAAL